jgi:hypothetical protein
MPWARYLPETQNTAPRSRVVAGRADQHVVVAVALTVADVDHRAAELVVGGGRR